MAGIRDFQKIYRTDILNSDEISKFWLFEEVPRMMSEGMTDSFDIPTCAVDQVNTAQNGGQLTIQLSTAY